MNAVERAAEVIRDQHAVEVYRRGYNASDLARALVDAGWHDGPHLSDADRAVLDAADEWADARGLHMMTGSFAGLSSTTTTRLLAAVRARRETQP